MFVAIKDMGQKLKFNLEKNSIVCGDCCNEEGEGWLNFIPDNSVDLIYIDPPFFSNRNYEIVWGNGFEVRSFRDRFKGGIKHYIEWMKPKLERAKIVLKDTGVIVFHCDKNASHKIRCLLDDCFGENNFVNEIIWYYRKWTNSPNIFQQNHDNIYIYKKDKSYIFNPKYQDARDVRDWKLNTVKDNGKRLNQIIIYDKQKTEKAFLEGRIKFKKKDLKVVYRTKNKVAMDDVWDLGVLSSNSPERIGYKTQKPERLIGRFIECFSNEQSIVLDFFGGGGTTAKVCSDLNRRFIIGDVSPVAVRVTADRLNAHGYKNYEIKALPSTKKEYLDMNSHKFADMICELMGWKTNTKKSGDGGIDGFADKGNIPIQIKNHKNKTGRPDIQKFLGALNRYKKGFFVSWGFSPEAWEFKASVENKKIEFIEIGKILNGLLISDDISTEHKKLYKKRVKQPLKKATKAKESELQKEKTEIQKEKKKEYKKLRKSRSDNP